MATTPVKYPFRVTSISEAGPGSDNVIVNFTEINEAPVATEGVTVSPPTMYSGMANFTRPMPSAEAANYFPGQVYDMTLTKRTTS